MNRVAENIKKVRESSGISAKALGKKLGVSESYITDVEQGRKVLNESMIQRISKIFGKNISDIGLQSFETEVVREEKQKRENKRPVRKIQNQEVNEPKKTEPLSDVWSQAFGENMRSVPVYSVELRTPLSQELFPITDGKIENHPQEKVVMIEAPDDSMKGFGITKGSKLMGIGVKEAIEEGFYLIESDSRKIRKVRNIGNGNLLITKSEKDEITETRSIKEVKVFLRFFMLKKML